MEDERMKLAVSAIESVYGQRGKDWDNDPLVKAVYAAICHESTRVMLLFVADQKLKAKGNRKQNQREADYLFQIAEMPFRGHESHVPNV